MDAEKEKKNELVFYKLQDHNYTGRALRALRRAVKKTAAETCTTLSDLHGLGKATEPWYEDIEEGRRELFFGEFKSVCKALGFEVKRVLECALMIKRKTEAKKGEPK